MSTHQNFDYIANYPGMRLDVRAPNIYAATVAAGQTVQQRLGREPLDHSKLHVVEAPRFTYLAILHGRHVTVRANTALEGKQMALEILKPRKKDLGLVAFGLVAKDNAPVTHVAVD